MGRLRTFVSIAAIGLAGCYDLSDPSGPHPEDFVRARDATEARDQEQTDEQGLTESRARTKQGPETTLILLHADMPPERSPTEAKHEVDILEKRATE